jgi:hypothetical protein
LKTVDNTTPWEKGAVIEADRLTKALDEPWQKRSSDEPLFSIRHISLIYKGRERVEKLAPELQAVPKFTVGATRLGLAISIAGYHK